MKGDSVARRALRRLVRWTGDEVIPAETTLHFNEAVNFEREVIFIAVPKTGTSSIRSQLSVSGPMLIPDPHLTILQVRDGLYAHFLKKKLGSNHHFPTRPNTVLSDGEIRDLAKETFRRFFKFASVRNPWARVFSLYHRREGIQTRQAMDFETFCKGLHYASDTCVHPARAVNQLDWMIDEKGSLAVDFVLRLEDFAAGLRQIDELTQGRLGLVEKHLNQNSKSASDSYRAAYTETTRAIVAEIFKRDIEFFGYEF
ncbi:MAG: sulfotransferase family 2 domain-containing protein [Pseudomonadota bacterium]